MDYDEAPIIINEGMKTFMAALLSGNIEINDRISDEFDNVLFDEFNKKKKFDIKHSKYSIDKYGMLIRENKFNKKDLLGWIYDEDHEPVNINITEEMKRTKTNDEIFDIIMSDYVFRYKKVKITLKSDIYKLAEILKKDITKFIYSKE